MRDASDHELRKHRPKEGLSTCVGHCLNELMNDQDHILEDEVSPNLTYEELIGALLLVQDLLADRFDEALKKWG